MTGRVMCRELFVTKGCDSVKILEEIIFRACQGVVLGLILGIIWALAVLSGGF